MAKLNDLIEYQGKRGKIAIDRYGTTYAHFDGDDLASWVPSDLVPIPDDGLERPTWPERWRPDGFQMLQNINLASQVRPALPPSSHPPQAQSTKQA